MRTNVTMKGYFNMRLIRAHCGVLANGTDLNAANSSLRGRWMILLKFNDLIISGKDYKQTKIDLNIYFNNT